MRGMLARTSAAVEHLALDEARHHQAGLGMDHFGRKARGVRGARRHHLAVAEHVVEREVAGDADDVLAGAVGGGKADWLEMPPGSGVELYRSRPDRQHGDTAFQILHYMPVSCGRQGPAGVLVSRLGRRLKPFWRWPSAAVDKRAGAAAGGVARGGTSAKVRAENQGWNDAYSYHWRRRHDRAQAHRGAGSGPGRSAASRSSG